MDTIISPKPEVQAAPQICEGVHSVSDADFGFWDHTWGHPAVHEFPCTNLAVMAVTDPFDGERYLLCGSCGNRA